MPILGAMLMGAGLGAGFGWLLARAKLCSGEACNVRSRFWVSIAAGAFFGAAVAYALASGT